MKAKTRSIEQMIEAQMTKWRLTTTEIAEGTALRPVVTISREPGSGGKLVAARIAEKMSLDLFHQEVIHAMAQSADISAQFVQTLDEKGLSRAGKLDFVPGRRPPPVAGSVHAAPYEGHRHHRQTWRGGCRRPRCQLHPVPKTGSGCGWWPPWKADRKCQPGIRGAGSRGQAQNRAHRIRPPGIYSKVLPRRHRRPHQLRPRDQHRRTSMGRLDAAAETWRPPWRIETPPMGRFDRKRQASIQGRPCRLLLSQCEKLKAPRGVADRPSWDKGNGKRPFGECRLPVAIDEDNCGGPGAVVRAGNENWDSIRSFCRPTPCPAGCRPEKGSGRSGARKSPPGRDCCFAPAGRIGPRSRFLPWARGS
jgi:hypothetical protein